MVKSSENLSVMEDVNQINRVDKQLNQFRRRNENGQGVNGRWTDEEQNKFVEAIQLYGRNWKKVEEHVRTRNGAQIRSHAQKYFQKIQKQGTSVNTQVSSSLQSQQETNEESILDLKQQYDQIKFSQQNCKQKKKNQFSSQIIQIEDLDDPQQLLNKSQNIKAPFQNNYIEQSKQQNQFPLKKQFSFNQNQNSQTSEIVYSKQNQNIEQYQYNDKLIQDQDKEMNEWIHKNQMIINNQNQKKISSDQLQQEFLDPNKLLQEQELNQDFQQKYYQRSQNEKKKNIQKQKFMQQVNNDLIKSLQEIQIISGFKFSQPQQKYSFFNPNQFIFSQIETQNKIKILKNKYSSYGQNQAQIQQKSNNFIEHETIFQQPSNDSSNLNENSVTKSPFYGEHQLNENNESEIKKLAINCTPNNFPIANIHQI